MQIGCIPELKYIGCISLVPRPSASRARIAYVTFEPLSDGCQLSDKGSKVTYAMRARLADGLGTRLRMYSVRVMASQIFPLKPIQNHISLLEVENLWICIGFSGEILNFERLYLRHYTSHLLQTWMQPICMVTNGFRMLLS